jgi:hypothetical protein
MSSIEANSHGNRSIDHVIDAINAIYEMEQTFPILRRYLKSLQGRIQAVRILQHLGHLSSCYEFI